MLRSAMPSAFHNQIARADLDRFPIAKRATTGASSPTATSPAPASPRKQARQVAGGMEYEEDHAKDAIKLEGDSPALPDQVDQLPHCRRTPGTKGRLD